MTGKKIFIFLLLSVLIASAAANCSEKLRSRHIRQAYNVFKRKAKNNVRSAAGYIRAGFHDCITANPDDPESGCNGSLKFEIPDDRSDRIFGTNIRLKEIMVDIEAVQKVFNCVSLADTILIAYAAASLRTRGGDILDVLVSDKIERFDVSKPDLNRDGGLDLPEGRESSFNRQLDFYKRKGMNAHDFVVSLVVGHSLGGFSPPRVDRIFEFTETSPNRVNGDYCGAILATSEFDLGNVALPQFNFLPSDFSLVNSTEGINIMKQFCSVDVPNKVRYTLKFGDKPRNYLPAFKEFSEKMGQLTGQSLRDAGL